MRLMRRKNIYVLMHMDTEVLKAEYDVKKHIFTEVTEVINEDHLPIGSRKEGTLSLRRLNYWHSRRAIPSYRVGLHPLLDALHASEPMDLVEDVHAVSLSDTYWLKKENEDLTWHDVCFYHKPFDGDAFASAMFRTSEDIDLDSARNTPGSVTAGFHRKAWIMKNGEPVLIKGGHPMCQEEPINEWLVTQIGKKLNINVLEYTTQLYGNHPVSVCPSMCNDHTDLVSGEMILMECGASKDVLQLDAYIRELKAHGIEDAEKKLSDQLLLDYIVMNTDRHAQNMAVLVDARTNQWIDTAPVFDTGTCLGCLVDDDEVLSDVRTRECTLLNRRQFDYDLLLEYIHLSEYDIDRSILELPREYGNMLVAYQPYTHISDERIENTYTLLYKRLRKTGKLIRNA